MVDPVDGGTTQTTLAQTNSTRVTEGLGCANTKTMFNNEMSFYRVFELADHDIANPFRVTSASFGVYRTVAGGGAGSQEAELRIYDYLGPVGEDTLNFSQFVQLTSTTFSIPDLDRSTVDVEIAADIDADSETFAVELFVPSGINNMNEFLVGANLQGERAPAYYRAPRCDYPEPTSLEVVDFPRDDYVAILSVNGEH